MFASSAFENIFLNIFMHGLSIPSFQQLRLSMYARFPSRQGMYVIAG